MSRWRKEAAVPRGETEPRTGQRRGLLFVAGSNYDVRNEYSPRALPLHASMLVERRNGIR